MATHRGSAEDPQSLEYRVVKHPGASMKKRGEWEGRFSQTPVTTAKKLTGPQLHGEIAKAKALAPSPVTRAGRHLNVAKLVKEVRSVKA